ncbi:MAG TPA: DUF2203 family protein [Thermoanaerobaculia bacterium]
MESEDIVAAFRRLAASRPPDVFEGALLVARLVDPEADLAGARRRVAELAERVALRRREGRAPLAALRAVLFEEEGFAGDTESYDEPPNCSVVHALAAHRGLPITLAVLAAEVGRRAGVRVEGVGLPGHFVLGGADVPDGQYLDPFDGGILHDTEALAQRVSGIFGTEIALSPEVFAPDPPGAILRRMLANLRRSWERRHRFEEALAALDCAEALEPGDPTLARDRARLLLETGEPEKAFRALETARAGSGEHGGAAPARKIFTLGEARSLLPTIREKTAEAAERFSRLGEGGEESRREREHILSSWAREMAALGVEIKGPWLVDFDSGAGYYCWKHPEASLEHFHGYEEGFAGRLRLQ